jgi:pimeloyl-ACP methyl ester carboxylesterase
VCCWHSYALLEHSPARRACPSDRGPFRVDAVEKGLRTSPNSDSADSRKQRNHQAQLAAIQAWGQGDATTLGTVQHTVLVVNGDDDVMVPSFNSFELARRLPKAQLSIFPDAGHGGIFQHHAAFVQQALAFLQQ